MTPRDPIEVARRVNAGVAVELRSQQARENHPNESRSEVLCSCERDFERLVAVVAELWIRLGDVETTADYAAELAENAQNHLSP